MRGWPGSFVGLWRWATQQACYLAALFVFYAEDVLLGAERLAALTGLALDPHATARVEPDDFLIGLCSVSQELVCARAGRGGRSPWGLASPGLTCRVGGCQARLVSNSVTVGDLARPVRISRFVADFHAGFRLLSLKNDVLRKRFDALKYDAKKIEGVVYDLSIRNLLPAPP